MKCEGFTPTEPIRLRHRLALADLEIRWDSDGGDDVILGILPVLANFFHDQITSATYDFSLTAKMIGDDHPRLRRVCYPLADALNKLSVGI